APPPGKVIAAHQGDDNCDDGGICRHVLSVYLHRRGKLALRPQEEDDRRAQAWPMLAAAWLTAGATPGLLLGAIITAWYAHKAFGTQAGQLDLLKQQREDEQGFGGQRSASWRRTRQWPGPPSRRAVDGATGTSRCAPARLRQHHGAVQ